MLFHYLPGFVPGGFVGVDVFFVISGYVITGLILKKRAQGQFHFLDFYAMRIRRLFPSLIFMFLIYFIFGSHYLLEDEFRTALQQIQAACLFWANQFSFAHTHYFESLRNEQSLLHLWSLGVEEQFYLIWPALLIVALRWRAQPLTWCLLIGGLSFALNLYWISHNPDADFFLMPARLWELSLGAAMILYQSQGGRPLALAYRLPLSIIGFLSIVVSSILIDSTTAFPGAWALVPTFGTCAIVLAGEDSAFNRRILSQPLAVALGKISYPLYLWQMPLYVLPTFFRFAGPDWVYQILQVATALGVAILCYFLLENPIRRAFELWPRKTALGLSLGIFACWLYSTYLLQLPSPSSLSESSRSISEKFRDGGGEGQDCHFPLPLRTENFYCQASGLIDTIGIALVGDSHADKLYPGIASAYQSIHQGVINLGVYGCPSYANLGFQTNQRLETERCLKQYQDIFSFLAHQSSIHTIILANADLSIYGWDFTDADRSPMTVTDATHLYLNLLDSQIQNLQTLNKRVLLIEDIPILKDDAHICVERSWDKIELQSECQIHKRLSPLSASGIAAGVPASVCVFDPAPLFAQIHDARVVRQSEVYYFDTNHLTLPGSLLVGQSFRQSSCFDLNLDSD